MISLFLFKDCRLNHPKAVQRIWITQLCRYALPKTFRPICTLFSAVTPPSSSFQKKSLEIKVPEAEHVCPTTIMKRHKPQFGHSKRSTSWVHLLYLHEYCACARRDVLRGQNAYAAPEIVFVVWICDWHSSRNWFSEIKDAASSLQFQALTLSWRDEECKTCVALSWRVECRK